VNDDVIILLQRYILAFGMHLKCNWTSIFPFLGGRVDPNVENFTFLTVTCLPSESVDCKEYKNNVIPIVIEDDCYIFA